MRVKNLRLSGRSFFTALMILATFFSGKSFAQSDMYANFLVSNSTDIQFPELAIDADQTNFAFESDLLGVLSLSTLRVRFPQSAHAGEVVNITVQSTNALLSANVLDFFSIHLFDSLGNEVAVSQSGAAVTLNLLDGATGIYAIRFFTDPQASYTFKEVRLDINSDLLFVNLLNSQFRIYSFFVQTPCPPVYADQVFAFSSGGLSTTTSPGNAVDADQTNVATLTDPLNLLNLLPPAFLDLQFPTDGKAGDFVGFTVGQASSLLSLALLGNINMYVYDDNGVLRDTHSGFQLGDLKLLSAAVNEYSLGFVTTTVGNYHIKRVRIELNAVLLLLENIDVYNAFHYAIDRKPVTVTENGPTTFCQGGSVTLTANDSLGSTNFLWSTGATTSSIVVTQSGSYTVQVIDSNSCARTSIPIVVTVHANPAPVIVGDSVLCFADTGTIHTALPYPSYVWATGVTPISTNAVVTVITPASYNVKVTDSNGCVGRDTIIVQRNNLIITPTITNAACSNTNSGSVSLSVTGGSGIYNYRWSNGSVSATDANLAPGLYGVIVKDSVYGCTYNRAYSIISNNTITIKNAILNTSGCGHNDGGATVTVIGGTGNYTYSWSNGQTTAALVGVTAGIYRLTLLDNNTLCTVSDTVAISDGGSSLVIIPTVVDNSSCNTPAGSISLAVTGGSGNYIYSWSTGAVTSSIGGLAAGTYYVIVKDVTANCSKTATVIVNNNNPIVINGSSTSPSQCGGTNGTLNITVTGGSGSYSYQWSNGATTQNLTGIQSGTYIVVVTDLIRGCTMEKVFTVTDGLNGPHATLTVTDESCTSNNNGVVSAAITGNIPNYVYTFSNGLFGPVGSSPLVLNNLAPGTYVLTISDLAGGCTSVYSATVAPKPQIHIVATPKANASCSASPNGKVTLVISGGLAPYSVNGTAIVGNTAQFNGLGVGNYNYNVVDANGCNATIIVPIIVDINAPVHITIDSTHPTACTGGTSGAIYTTETGGSAPYFYTWIGPNGLADTTADLLHATAGNYQVTVTDQNGCSDTASANIVTEHTDTVILHQDQIVPATCFGIQNGAIYESITSGVVPITYVWTPGNATTQDLVNVNPGTYSVVATDALGCKARDTATIGIDSSHLVLIHLDSLIGAGCQTGHTAAIILHVSGGVLPYSYAWSNGSHDSDLLNVTPGQYGLTVTDAIGCKAFDSLSAIVDISHLATIMGDSIKPVTGCPGISANGALYVTVTNGFPPYSYSWNGPNGYTSTNMDITGLAVGVYALVVSDTSGCSSAPFVADVTFDSTNILAIQVDSVTKVNCFSPFTGAIAVHATGGESPYSYHWTNGGSFSSFNQNVSGLPVGTYTVTAQDLGQCQATKAVTIGQYSVNIAFHVADVSCFGMSTGSVETQITGGTGNYNYAWSNGATTSSIDSVPAGAYSVVVSDPVTGCSGTDSATINSPSEPLSVSGTITEDGCIPGPDGSIVLSVIGGTTPYTYAWSNGTDSSAAINLLGGNYSVTVTDANGCTPTSSSTVTFMVPTTDCNTTVTIPDVITPNGDGVNDTWIITGLHFYPNNKVQVFDKWGDVVFEETNYNNDWRGTRTNGDPLPGGTYFYLIKLNDNNLNGNKNAFTGSILVQP